MTEDELNDQIAAMRQGMDQAAAATRELGAMMGTYFLSLLMAGFERAEALDLVMGFQEQFLAVTFTPAEVPAGDEDDD